MSMRVRERVEQSAYGRMRNRKTENREKITARRNITPYKTILFLQSK